jgi:tripartite-type tricarboxylate transporter receptor subunit TctC
VPTATEAGYDVQVAQARAIAAPKGTPPEILSTLKDAYTTAFATQEYKDFNQKSLLTPHEVDGAQVKTEWTEAKENYKKLTEQYGIDLGGEQ